jgi:hypothetical protein
MRTLTALSGIVGLFFVVSPSFAAVERVDNESDFLDAIVKPGYYLEDFGSYATGNHGLFMDFSGNGFEYTASSPEGLWINTTGYPTPHALSTNDSEVAIHIAFTGADVTAVGGFLFPTNVLETRVTGTVHVTLVNGGTFDIDADYDSPPPFTGFTSDVAIASIDVTTTENELFPTIDHFYVGTAAPTNVVPEPASLLIWSGVGAVGLGIVWRRRQRKAA